MRYPTKTTEYEYIYSGIVDNLYIIMTAENIYRRISRKMYYITYCIIYFVPRQESSQPPRFFSSLPEGKKKFKGMRKCIRKRNKGSKNTTHFGAEGQNIIYFLVYTIVNEVFHNIIIKCITIIFRNRTIIIISSQSHY